MGVLEHIDVLIVDDDEDVRAATRLALKRKRFRDKPICLTMADSKKQAIEILQSGDVEFHVLIVDVVMEEDDAGLQLCNWIRHNCSPHCRIILRTGQPGMAPEAEVLEKVRDEAWLVP
jgi:CheY-like chemotaxis protein